MIVKKKLKITNPQGLHARPASIFVQIANKFEADVMVRKGSEKVSGKSIMGLMMLAASQGNVIEIEASGVDAEQVVAELERFLTHDEDPGHPVIKKNK